MPARRSAPNGLSSQQRAAATLHAAWLPSANCLDFRAIEKTYHPLYFFL
jgi:hypothetical protein